MSKPCLSQTNELTLLDSGVWVTADESGRAFIDYSDGDASEQAVYDLVAQAKDRSLASVELNKPWSEWAFEYHLTSKRANVYRGINLAGVKTVLEVGCGCGAITRFLGEQGFTVDSIEGSMRRAEIARLRTADLHNVNIVASNYHDMVMPKSGYDLIVFTGVLEYSGAYASAGLSPEQQLVVTLRAAYASLADGGRILVAIENRLGAKYVLGASEDHLNRPNIGLLKYPEPVKGGNYTRGIRTWSRSEWAELLVEAGVPAHGVMSAYPDYKVPELMVSDDFHDNEPYSDELLGGIASRDYFKYWTPPVAESVFWKSAKSAGCLKEYANSFLLVLAADAAVVNRTINLDFIRFANASRKPQYQVQIMKLSNHLDVQRVPLVSEVVSSDVVEHVCEPEPYLSGRVLHALWQQQLKAYVDDISVLKGLLSSYHHWLGQQFLQSSEPERLFDALPQNIIVNEAGDWCLFDKEWRLAGAPSVQRVYYRAVLALALSSGADLSETLRRAQEPARYQSVQEFVSWAMSCVAYESEDDFADIRAAENEFQREVMNVNAFEPIESVLAASLFTEPYETHFVLPPAPMSLRVFWSGLRYSWHMDHSMQASESMKKDSVLNVLLPNEVREHQFLRIDPIATIAPVVSAQFSFGGLRLIARVADKDTELLRADTLAELTGMAALVDFVEAGDRLWSVSRHSKIVINLAGLKWPDSFDSIHLEFGFDNNLSNEYLETKRALKHEDDSYLLGLRSLHAKYTEDSESKERYLEELEMKLLDKVDQVHALNAGVAKLQTEQQRAQSSIRGAVGHLMQQIVRKFSKV